MPRGIKPDFQIRANTAKSSYHYTNFDDPGDTANIMRGINSYSSGFLNSFSRNFLDVLYNFSGVRIIFHIGTAAYFGLHSFKKESK
jgi:hypothetical protein